MHISHLNVTMYINFNYIKVCTIDLLISAYLQRQLGIAYTWSLLFQPHCIMYIHFANQHTMRVYIPLCCIWCLSLASCFVYPPYKSLLWAWMFEKLLGLLPCDIHAMTVSQHQEESTGCVFKHQSSPKELGWIKGVQSANTLLNKRMAKHMGTVDLANHALFNPISILGFSPSQLIECHLGTYSHQEGPTAISLC